MKNKKFSQKKNLILIDEIIKYQRKKKFLLNKIIK